MFDTKRSLKNLIFLDKNNITNILPASGIRHPASGIRHPASGIRHPASGIRHPASGIISPFRSLSALW
jgi:hypothetical protein